MTSVLHLGGRKMKEPVKRGRPSMKGIANTIASDAPKTWRARILMTCCEHPWVGRVRE